MKKSSFTLSIFLTYIAATLTSCGCGSSCGKSGHASKQEIKINIAGEPSTLDPRKTRSLRDMNLARNLMEGLMRVNKTGVTSPALAEKYQVSEDMKTYTFMLRESKWSNGDPLTAHDFEYAWKKLLAPDFLSDYAFMLYSIKNAKAIKQGILPATMLGVEAKDDYTLVVNLEYPVPFFLELVTTPTFFPINKSVDIENPGWCRSPNTYVSNGPFQLLEWKHHDQIIATKNPNYWDAEAVQLERIAMVMVEPETGMRMFENHELDWEGSPFSSIPTDNIESLAAQNQIYSDPMLGTYWIRTNTSLYPFHNENFRKALAVSIDRQQLVDHVVLGSQTPATGIVPASMGLQNTPYFEDGNCDQAMSMLKVALEEESLTIEKMPEITLTYVSDNRAHRMAQAIQDQWKQSLGICVKLEPLESKVYFSRISKGDYQLACGSWIADFRDPINFLEVFKTKHVGTNNTNWESMDYQKAIANSYAATTESERKESLRQSEEIIMDEMPVIPVFHYTMLHVKNDTLCDVVLTEGGQIDFKWARVK